MKKHQGAQPDKNAQCPFSVGDAVVSVNSGHHPGLPAVVTGIQWNPIDHEWQILCDVETSLLTAECIFSPNALILRAGLLS